MPSPEITSVLSALDTKRPEEIQQAADVFLATLDPRPNHKFFVGLNSLVIAVREHVKGGLRDQVNAGTLKREDITQRPAFAPDPVFAASMLAAYDARFPRLGPDHRKEFTEATSDMAGSWLAADIRDQNTIARAEAAAQSYRKATSENEASRRRRRPN